MAKALPFPACAQLLAAYPPTAGRYLVGVSGGRDSVALLHWLLSQGFTDLVVCHLDHALRSESATDAAFVSALADRHQLAFFSRREDVGLLARQSRQSLETAARQARYDFFERAARQFEVHTVFLAHHADDQAETFLFNLLRGTGSAGLGVMRAESSRSINGTQLAILRPLLEVSRAQIDAYIECHQLQFREDSSNSSSAHSRNRIRYHLLPEIETLLGREVRRSLLRTAEILRAEDDFLRSLVPELPQELSATELRSLPIALQRRYLHTWLKQEGVPEVGFDVVEAVRALLSGTPAKVNLPGSFHARRRAKRLFIQRPENLT